MIGRFQPYPGRKSSYTENKGSERKLSSSQQEREEQTNKNRNGNKYAESFSRAPAVNPSISGSSSNASSIVQRSIPGEDTGGACESGPILAEFRSECIPGIVGYQLGMDNVVELEPGVKYKYRIQLKDEDGNKTMVPLYGRVVAAKTNIHRVYKTTEIWTLLSYGDGDMLTQTAYGLCAESFFSRLRSFLEEFIKDKYNLPDHYPFMGKGIQFISNIVGGMTQQVELEQELYKVYQTFQKELNTQPDNEKLLYTDMIKKMLKVAACERNQGDMKKGNITGQYSLSFTMNVNRSIVNLLNDVNQSIQKSNTYMITRGRIAKILLESIDVYVWKENDDIKVQCYPRIGNNEIDIIDVPDSIHYERLSHIGDMIGQYITDKIQRASYGCYEVRKDNWVLTYPFLSLKNCVFPFSAGVELSDIIYLTEDVCYGVLPEEIVNQQLIPWIDRFCFQYYEGEVETNQYSLQSGQEMSDSRGIEKIISPLAKLPVLDNQMVIWQSPELMEQVEVNHSKLTSNHLRFHHHKTGKHALWEKKPFKALIYKLTITMVIHYQLTNQPPAITVRWTI